MTEVLTAGQMRAVERAAIESGAVTGLELMERAGRGVVAAVFEEWPDLVAAPQRALVLCGPGNNGGDGFVIARLLKEWGWAVELFLMGDAERLPPDAKVNCARWAAMGPVGDWSRVGRALAPDLVVDALFGTGLARPVDEAVTAPIRALAERPERPRIVAVDIASGMDADSGRALGPAGFADLTVTFHRAKPGHYLAEGPGHSGRLRVWDIGLEGGAQDRVHSARAPCGPGNARPAPQGGRFTPTPGRALPFRWASVESHSPQHATGGAIPGAARLARPSCVAKPVTGHKYASGHALVLSGGAGRTGAARLAARGALRVGAGLVTLGVPGSAQMEVASQITAIMLARVEDGAGLAGVLEDGRINALCLGPGLGIARARGLVEAALAETARAVVLDADALTAFADAPQALFDRLHGGCVLTPHGGEFARLFPDLAERLAAPASEGQAFSKVDAVRAAAARAGCVVLLKGADTVIAGPDGACVIHAAVYDRAAPWLATAGSGDVLAGVITGLLARGFAPLEAAETAVWLHVECARGFGPGLIAEDLPEALPGMLRALEA